MGGGGGGGEGGGEGGREVREGGREVREGDFPHDRARSCGFLSVLLHRSCSPAHVGPLCGLCGLKISLTTEVSPSVTNYCVIPDHWGESPLDL